MKLENITVADVATGSKFGGNEALKVRIDRMRKFWADPKNATLFIVGRLLASTSGGKSLAQHLIDESEIELSQITSNGQVLPLVAGFKLSLNSIDSWGCIACGSAHGSGVYPSKKADLNLLESNKFYYNPQTRQLYTISTTCFGDYVKALGAATASRFIPASEEIMQSLTPKIAPAPVSRQVAAPVHNGGAKK